jgi:putative hydrolase of HD superfamily
MTPEDRIIDVVLALDPLADLPRTGWLLRGVSPCESIADHSFGVALAALLLTDELRAAGEQVDGERVLRMAIVHDAPEAKTGDIPMPSKTAELDRAVTELETRLVATLLPERLARDWAEAEAGETLEAKIVKAADKIQMMIKVIAYERQRGAHLDEFWANPKNFRDMGLPLAQRVFDRLRERAGRSASGLAR